MLELDISLVFTIIDVLILYFILKKFLFGRVRKVMDERKKEIDQSYATADQRMKEADEKKAQMERELAAIGQTREESLVKARKDAGFEYDRIISEAHTRSDEILEETRRKAEAEAAQARKKADDEITAMVKEAAAKIVETDSDKELYDSFLDQTEKEKEIS
jgi:F-type H+-transporting ATPase subunit b